MLERTYHRAIHPAAGAVAGQRGPRGVGAGRTVDRATGMRRGAGQEHPVHGGVGAAQAGGGPEDQLLMQGGGALVDGPADESGIVLFEFGGALDGTAEDATGEPRCVPFDDGLDPIGEPFAPVGGPYEIPGYMGVRPDRLGARR